MKSGGRRSLDKGFTMNCLVYLPHSYTGRGPAESCIQIIQQFAKEGLETTVVVARKKKEIPSEVKALCALPSFAKFLPWRWVSDFALDRVDRLYREALDQMTPGVAYFWPTVSAELVAYAKSRGWVTVREMTNRAMASSKRTLDEAFAKAGEQKQHHISQAAADKELAVLPTFDFVFSSNEDVDASLLLAKVEADRILKTTFGWAEERYSFAPPAKSADEEFVVGYLGMISIGKGIKDLIEGWKIWNGNGRLRLAGPLDWSMENDVKQLIASDPRAEFLGYVEDIAGFYQTCDVLVIPTLDEGGPQVTYEIGAAGAAIIATPMARARMLRDGKNAIIVSEHSPEAISEALEKLAQDPDLRLTLGQQAKVDAKQFSYTTVGTKRARLLINLVEAKPPEAGGPRSTL